MVLLSVLQEEDSLPRSGEKMLPRKNHNSCHFLKSILCDEIKMNNKDEQCLCCIKINQKQGTGGFC